MQTFEKNNSQKKRLSALLLELNKNITEGDRAEFSEEKNISKTTISNYMNGRVANVDLAMEMLLFFRKKIETREKLIQN